MSLIESILKRLGGIFGRSSAGGNSAQLAAAQATGPMNQGGNKEKAPSFEGDVINVTGHLPFEVPAGLSCQYLNLASTGVKSLPDDLNVEGRLILRDCLQLTDLPDGLKVGTLDLTNCQRLERLPAGLVTNFLIIDGCSQLSEWPEDCEVALGALSMRGCHLMDSLPRHVSQLAYLNLRDCHLISSLPEDLVVTSWVDIGGTQVSSLPASMSRAQLRWKGVVVTPRIAFEPDSIRGKEVLDEQNAEVRRVMMERIGLERFLEEVKAVVIDEDEDPGGKRQLLKVSLVDDEDLVCVSVRCPSTDRHYLIRVPPTIETCHAAVAWTAGFDNPDDYRPVVET